MINIEEIAAICWKKTYGLPLSLLPSPGGKAHAIEFASLVARKVMAECISEIVSIRVVAPDSEIVKERITTRLRVVASEIPHQENRNVRK